VRLATQLTRLATAFLTFATARIPALYSVRSARLTYYRDALPEPTIRSISIPAWPFCRCLASAHFIWVSRELQICRN
jgi:hypothetical protein